MSKMKIGLIVAIVLVVVGVPCWASQMAAPQFGEGLVTWGLNIDVFFLAAGIGSALLALVGASFFTKALPAVSEQRRRFSVVSLACLVVACLVVFLDAGLPVRVFEIIFHPQFQSLFVWDFYLITLGAILALVGAFGRGGKIAGGLGIVAGCAVMLIEGTILAVCTGTPLWHGNIALPVLFLAEGLVAALAVVLLLAPSAAEKGAVVPAIIGLCAFVGVVNVVEVIVGGYLGNGEEALTAQVMVAGSLAPLFWLQLLVGIVVPIVLLAARRGARPVAVAAALCVLAGVFMGKYMTLMAGQAVLATGELSAYVPSLLEIGACAGYFGLVLLISCAGTMLAERAAAPVAETEKTPAPEIDVTEDVACAL